MVKMNDIMKEILKDEEGSETCLQVDAILKEIVDKTKLIHDCVIYDEYGTLEENEINFDRIIKFVGDWTGYEVSCNEVKFERVQFSPNQFLVLATKLSYMLSQKYMGKKIVVYILLSEKELELRFHTQRENERVWLDEDLNKYGVPVLCCV